MVNKAVKTIAKDFGVSEAEVQSVFEQNYDKQIAAGRPEKPAKTMAERLTQLHFKKNSIGTPTEKMRFIPIGQKEAMDSSKQEYDRIVQNFKANPQKSIAEGYTDANGIPLDRKKDFGKDGSGKVMENKNYGKPMRPNWMRVTVGVDTADKKLKTFILKYDQAINATLPMFDLIEINGKPKSNDPLTWNGAKNTKIISGLTRNEEEIELLNIDTMVDKYLKNYKMDIEMLEEWVDTHGNKDILITEADVLTIDMEPNATGSRTLILDNGSEWGQRCFVPPNVPITFGEMSRIVIVAAAKKGKGEYGPTMTAMGLWAIPDFLIPAEFVDEADQAIDPDAPEHKETADKWNKGELSEGTFSGVHDENGDEVYEEEESEEEALKVATPALMMKIIIRGDKGEGMPKAIILKQANENGYSAESVESSLDQLVEEGEAMKTDDDRYMIVE